MKARFFALATLVLGMVSCQQDVDTIAPVGGEVDFQISVAAPELAGTRAGENGEADTQNAMDSAFGAIDYLQGAATGDYRQDWGDVDLRYTLEVYDVADNYAGAVPVKDRQVIIKDSYEPVVFDLRLVPNRDYHFVVFADFVAQDEYKKDATAQLSVDGIRHDIGDTLADIILKNEAINDEVADSYFATKDIKVTNSAAQDIVLKRPYGKLRVVATDLAELNLNVHPKSVVVEYESLNPNKFDAVTGDIKGEYAVKQFTTTFVENVRDNMGSHYYNVGYDAETAPAVNGTVRNTHITLFTDYILGENAQTDGTYPQTPIHFTMTVNDGKGGEIKTTAFTTDIPVERNKLTTVIGNVLTTATEIEVRIDDNFAGENIIETDEVADQASFLKALEEAAKKEYAAIELTGDVEWETGASHGSTPLIGADAKTKSLTIYGNGRTFTATGKGVGPIRMANDGKLIFQDVVFVDESVSYNEGAWELGYLEFAGELEFINCEFKNAVMMCGGTANNDTGANAKFTGCKFNSGDANQYDVWVSGDNAYFNECTFEGYRGIKVHEAYGSEVAEVVVDKCQFNNLSKKPGMAIGTVNAATKIEIKNSTFTNCQAGDQGLYIYETDTDVTSFTFIEQNNVIAFVDANLTKTLTLKAGTYDLKSVNITTDSGAAIAIAEDAEVTIFVAGDVKLNGKTAGIAVPDSSKLTIEGVAETRSADKFGNLNVVANGGFGIGGIGAEVTIKNTTIDYICGWPIQPLFIKDLNYGKSEPEGYSAIGGAKIVLENVEIKKAEGGSKAAAIGNRYWQSTDITIKNSILGDIFGGNASAAIGGSRYSSNATKHNININIEGSTITNAVGGQFAAGIGAGYDTHCSANDSNAVNNIVITNSNITVKGGQYGAGIGTGYHSAALTGSIDAASTINATDGGSRDKYTAAMPVGYGVVDPAREFNGVAVTFTVAGETIAHPLYAGYEKMNDGAYFDEANNKYYITNAAGLKWVADVVNATTPYTATIFDEAVVELSNDIDLNNEEWIPIGDDRSQRTEWHGVFDGKEYTVKNVKITKKTDRNDENKSSYGLFGNVKGTVKNLTVENVSISGAPKFIGALIGRLNDGLVENCHVKSSSVECNNWTIGGLVGQLNNGKISGCSVEGTTIKGYAAVGAIAGIALNSGERTIENCSVKNCSIVKNGSFGGDFDKMFGAVLGAVYNGSLTVYINGCSVESTTVLGEVSSTIFGHATEGDQVFVDGVCFTPTSVATADALVEALENGESVLFEDDVKIEPAGMSNAYGTTGINVKNGQTIDGGGHILDIKGAGGTWDSGISTTGGMIKNITVTGSFRGIFINHNSENCSKVYLDNVIIDGTTYTISCDQGTNNGLEATNSTFKGWTSYAATLGNAKFTDCYFGYGNGYSYCRPYAPTEFVGCEFEAGFRLDPRADVTFESCTLDGVALTAANIAELVTNTEKVTIK